jgi:hypothetical protein
MAGEKNAYFESPEALEIAVEQYFEYIKGEKDMIAGPDGKLQEVWHRYPEPATVTGMAFFLGFESRQSVYDYEKRGAFSYLIKRCRLRVEFEYEKKLTQMEKPTGAIFALKNMGWADRTETEITGKDGAPLIPPTIKLPDGTNLEI